MKNAHITKHFVFGLALAATSFASTAAAVEQPLCDELIWEECLDDTLNVQLSTGGYELTSASVGTAFDIRTTIDVRSPELAGWSYGVFADPAYLSVMGTDHLSSDSSVQDASFLWGEPAHTSNNGFIQAVVLSFTTAAELPLGEHDLVMQTAGAEVMTAVPTAGTEIIWADGLQGSGQPVSFTLVQRVTSRLPRKIRSLVIYP